MTHLQPVAANTSFDFSLGGLTNPETGVLTDPFQLLFADDQDYPISSAVNQSSLRAKMTQPYLITSGARISTNTSVPTSAIVITIKYFVAHDVPQGSTLQIIFPPQLTPDPAHLGVLSPQTTSLAPVSLVNDTIVGTDFFSISVSGGSVLELIISGFHNPDSSTPTDPFIISLFTADGSTLDELQQSNLVVASKCNYPCKDCNASSPSVCTACMTSDMGPFTLLEEGQCV